MRHKMLFVLAVAATSAVLVPVASADKPIKEPAPAPDTFTGQFCDDFMVQVNVLVNDNFPISFGDGRVFIGGRLVIEAINLETGESVTANVSGPVFIGPSGDPFVLRGNAILFAAAADFGPGTPAALVVTSGTVTFLAGVPGYTLQGHSRDLCAELA
jgi:hypothetical protein